MGNIHLVDVVTAPYRMAQTWMQGVIRGGDGKREMDSRAGRGPWRAVQITN